MSHLNMQQKYWSRRRKKSTKSPRGIIGVPATFPSDGRSMTPGGSLCDRLRWHKIPFKSRTNNGWTRNVSNEWGSGGNCLLDSYKLQLVTIRISLEWEGSKAVDNVGWAFRAQVRIRSSSERDCWCLLWSMSHCSLLWLVELDFSLSSRALFSLFCCLECLIFFFLTCCGGSLPALFDGEVLTFEVIILIPNNLQRTPLLPNGFWAFFSVVVKVEWKSFDLIRFCMDGRLYGKCFR